MPVSIRPIALLFALAPALAACPAEEDAARPEAGAPADVAPTEATAGAAADAPPGPSADGADCTGVWLYLAPGCGEAARPRCVRLENRDAAAIAFSYCGCDGQPLHDGRGGASRPFRHEGACLADGGAPPTSGPCPVCAPDELCIENGCWLSPRLSCRKVSAVCRARVAEFGRQDCWYAPECERELCGASPATCSALHPCPSGSAAAVRCAER